MIEGTRNEKVMILLASYVIGFTTAYIAYGINLAGMQDALPVNYTASMTASVAQAEPVVVANFEITADGLEVTVDGEPFLVSAHVSTVPEEMIADFGYQGIHERVEGMSLSSSGSYLYFCEYPPEAVGCAPFVYDTVSKIIYPVTVYNYSDPVFESQLAFDGDFLKSDELISLSPDEPWLLIQHEAWVD
jgi:hypothetical protein